MHIDSLFIECKCKSNFVLMDVHMDIPYCLAGGRRTGTRASGQQMLDVVRTRTVFGDRTFAAAAACIWNGLPDNVRDFFLSEDVFAKWLKTFLMN